MVAIYRTIGAYVRDARTEAARTQDDLAAALGITRSSIANLEAGRQRIPIHMLVLLANELGVKVSRLLPDSITEIGSFSPSEEVLEKLADTNPKDQEFIMQTLGPMFRGEVSK